VQRRCVYDAASRHFVPYLPGLSATDLDFSRDGQWMTYVAYPSGTLWRSKTDGSERLQLSSLPMHIFLPRWSPDGKRIAFNGTPPGQRTSHIYIVPAEGGKPEQVTHEQANDASWSADGKTLVFGPASPDQPIDIRLVGVATGRVTKLAGSNGSFSPRWSPDGKYIVALHHDGYQIAPTRLQLPGGRNWDNLEQAIPVRLEIRVTSTLMVWSPHFSG